MEIEKEEFELNDSTEYSFLYKATARSCMFFAFFLIILFLFYISGNYQNFLDSTQRFVLLLCSFSCFLFFLFSIAGFIESIVFFFMYKKKRYLIIMTGYLFSSIISPVLYYVIRLILHLSFGITQ